MIVPETPVVAGRRGDGFGVVFADVPVPMTAGLCDDDRMTGARLCGDGRGDGDVGITGNVAIPRRGDVRTDTPVCPTVADARGKKYS